jgi:hypothetical protein
MEILLTVATIAAAVAAWCSYMVSRDSLEFQKTYAENMSLIEELNRTIYKAETLQILVPEPLKMPDDEFNSIDSLITNLQSELKRLDIRNVINYGDLKISSVNNKYELSEDVTCLKEVIQTLISKHAKVFR